jgi:hypothetical protein
MPQVPIYQQQVGTDAPGVPTPQVVNPQPTSAGLNITEAQAGLGKQIEEGGSQLGRSIIYSQRLEAQQAAYDKATAASAELHDRAHAEDGWLTRQGANAFGITSGSDPKKVDKDSFDGFIPDWKNRYMKGAGPYEQKILHRLLDTQANVMRNSVVNHESNQRKIAREHAAENQVISLNDLSAIAANPDDVSELISQAKEIRRESAIRKGANPETEDGKLALELADTKTADEFAVTAIKANMERDPAKAMQFLKALRPQMSGVEAAKMDSMLEGKMLELRVGAAWERLKHYTNQDGTHNIGLMDMKLQKMVAGYPVHQREHIVKEVLSRARLADSELKNEREDQQRQFDNESLMMQQKGVPIDQAEDVLFKQRGYGFDAVDVEKKKEQLLKTYMKDESIYDRMAEHWNEAQKLAFKQIADSAEVADKFPDSHEKQQFLDSFKQQLFEGHITKPADMQRVFQENLKTVPTGQPGLFRIFGGKTDAYYKVAEALQQNQSLVKAVGGTDAAYQLAQRLGGPDAFAPDSAQSKAIMALIESGAKPNQITPASIEAVIQKYPNLVK